jgi:Uma2 family endonuclease
VSEADYLALERTSETKHELHDGVILAMAGASRAHNEIQANILLSLGAQVRGRGCRIYAGDLRVRVNVSHYFYPDVTVVCGKPDFTDFGGVDTLLNPTVVIEITSPSTSHQDHHYKLMRYMTISSLRQIALIAQDVPAVTLLTRTEADTWLYGGVIGRESTLTLTAIGCTLALADVYENVDLPPDEMGDEAAQEDAP